MNPEIENPAITFRVTKFDSNGVSFEYELFIHRENGRSESRGTALIGEVLQVSKEEMQGNLPVIDLEY